MHKSLATKFCKVAPNIYGPALWNLLHFTLLAQNFELAPRFLGNYCIPLFHIEKQCCEGPLTGFSTLVLLQDLCTLIV